MVTWDSDPDGPVPVVITGRAEEKGARVVRLVVAYDGTGLSGWQRQADDPTVQGHLEEALARVAGHPVTVQGAGRTDAGVHARGQVAHFKTRTNRTCEAFLKGGNSLLPNRIAILEAETVSPEFHARFSAKSKIYDYDILNTSVRFPLLRNYAWHLPRRLDIDRIREALSLLPGEHDFAAFQSTGSIVQSTTRRMLDASLSFPGEGLVRISLEADGFLRHMVRAIVGTLVMVGQSRITVERFREILRSADRSQAGPTAPAQGLCLRLVKYE